MTQYERLPPEHIASALDIEVAREASVIKAKEKEVVKIWREVMNDDNHLYKMMVSSLARNNAWVELTPFPNAGDLDYEHIFRHTLGEDNRTTFEWILQRLACETATTEKIESEFIVTYSGRITMKCTKKQPSQPCCTIL